MHWVVHIVRPRLVDTQAALYGCWLEWRTSNQSGWPVSMGDALRLTAPYLNQALVRYLGGVSELDAALHLPDPPNEDLEVEEVTIFVEGAGFTPPHPRPKNLVYDRTRPTPPYAVVCDGLPEAPTWCLALMLAAHTRRSWAQPHLSSPQFLWKRNLGTPLLLHVVATRRDPERVLGATSTHLYGAPPVLCPAPPGARGTGRGAYLHADLGGHNRQSGPPLTAPPATSNDPRGPRTLRPARDSTAPPAPGPVPVDDLRPMTTGGYHHEPPPSPAAHGTTHGTPQAHWEIVGQARL